MLFLLYKHTNSNLFSKFQSFSLFCQTETNQAKLFYFQAVMAPTELPQFTGNREASPQSGCCDQNFKKPSSSTSNKLGDLTPQRPRFFQIITDDGEAEQEKKLWIPRRFVRKYGHDLSKYVQVTDPSGRKWKLECSKCDSDTWFRNGWQDFVDFYSLAYGHLLLFEYGGNSRFSVAIFDKTATEIEYPVKSTHDDGDSIDGTDIDELVAEILDEFIPIFKEKKKCHQSSSDQKTISDNSPAKAKKLSFSDEEYKVLSIAEKCKHRMVDERTEQLKGNKKSKDLDSPYPSFSLVMRPSYLISSSVRLYIPFSFADDYIIEEQGDAILYSDERRWDVKYFSDLSSSIAALGSGWKIFASENDLKAGDVCVFELINKTDVTFRVHIHRIDENSNPSPSGGNKKTKKTHVQLKEQGTIESADKFTSENPCFRVVMQSYCLNSPYMNIPIDFAEKHLGQETKNISVKMEKRSWTVQFCAPGRLCGGWYTFVKANSLQDGDICIFELVKKPELMLEVRIFRGN